VRGFVGWSVSRPAAPRSNIEYETRTCDSRCSMSYDQMLLLQTITSFLHRNPGGSLLMLSQELHISRRTVQATIKATKGKGFRDFRQEILMTRLRNLLLSRPDWTIKQISLELGYTCPQSFSRAVKRACGVSPCELRSKVAKTFARSRDVS